LVRLKESFAAIATLTSHHERNEIWVRKMEKQLEVEHDKRDVRKENLNCSFTMTG